MFINKVLQGCVSFGHLLEMGPNNWRSLEWVFKREREIHGSQKIERTDSDE